MSALICYARQLNFNGRPRPAYEVISHLERLGLLLLGYNGWLFTFISCVHNSFSRAEGFAKQCHDINRSLCLQGRMVVYSTDNQRSGQQTQERR